MTWQEAQQNTGVAGGFQAFNEQMKALREKYPDGQIPLEENIKATQGILGGAGIIPLPESRYGGFKKYGVGDEVTDANNNIEPDPFNWDEFNKCFQPHDVRVDKRTGAYYK